MKKLPLWLITGSILAFSVACQSKQADEKTKMPKQSENQNIMPESSKKMDDQMPTCREMKHPSCEDKPQSCEEKPRKEAPRPCEEKPRSSCGSCQSSGETKAPVSEPIVSTK